MHVRTEETIDDFWDGLLDTEENEYIAVVKGYLDASTRKDSGLLSVSICLIESGRVRRFRQRWRDTFGPEPFSWADLVARQFPFEHLSDRNDAAVNKEHDRLMAAGVALVRESVIAGVSVSMWTQDVQNYAPTWIKGFGHAYSIAGHMAMTATGNWFQRNGYRGGISYVIEEGDDGWDQLAHLLTYVKNPDVKALYQWAGDSRAAKTTGAPFHAPDLLAWEWGRYWQETVFEQRRRMRRSLFHLLNGHLDQYAFLHLGGDALMKFFNSVHDLGVEQLEEARAQLSPTSSVDVTLPSEPIAPDEGQQ